MQTNTVTVNCRFHLQQGSKTISLTINIFLVLIAFVDRFLYRTPSSFKVNHNLLKGFLTVFRLSRLT